MKLINNLKNQKFKEGLVAGLFLSFIFMIGFYVGAIYVFSQRQQQYTVFRTDNYGFKFKNSLNEEVPIYIKGLNFPNFLYEYNENRAITEKTALSLIKNERFKIIIRPDNIVFSMFGRPEGIRSVCGTTSPGQSTFVSIEGGSNIDDQEKFSYPSTLSFYSNNRSNKAILYLASLNFNKLRNIHGSEIMDYSSKLSIYLSQIKSILFDMYLKDNGSCRLFFISDEDLNNQYKTISEIGNRRISYLSIVVAKDIGRTYSPENSLPRMGYTEINWASCGEWPSNNNATSGYILPYTAEIRLDNKNLMPYSYENTFQLSNSNYWIRIRAEDRTPERLFSNKTLNELLMIMNKVYIECRVLNNNPVSLEGAAAALKITFSSDHYSH